jgi:uncharacterized protein YjbI with pentapeptide repeats
MPLLLASRRIATRVFTVSTLVLGGCAGAIEPVPGAPDEETDRALSGENLSGTNLGGANLSGTNLGGANLGGANLGGSNLGGANLGGANLGGTNLGGNNLGGNNLGGTNLGGANLGGKNLGGANLGGANLGGSNLGGSNLGGTNLGGNNLGGTNLGGANLSAALTGQNIHGLSSASGMLYSGEDRWSPKTAQCVVLGIGSTAFAKLLGQQSANARISVALGMLPWGFASTSGGPITLRAWEAVVWGDKTYCVFVLASPPGTSWAGVAGFIKAVFRWNAPPTQSMDISGIEASAAYDPTLSTAIATYTGMMNAAARWRAGTITAASFVAGELAFSTATTNNQSVLVDFSSWVQDSNGNALVLGNVDPSSPPPYAEALYIALDNGDGTVSIVLDDAASRTSTMPAGMFNSVADLNMAYQAWKAGIAPKPVPRRCGGALFLNTWYDEAVPTGKCDSGLAWAEGFCIVGADPWSVVPGTTGPMNGYMQLTQPRGAYKRSPIINGAMCGALKTVISETYVHMWARAYDLPGACTPESDASFCGRLGRNCGSVTATDNCGAVRSVAVCGTCAAPLTCGGSGQANVCGNPNNSSYEAEALGNTLAGTAYVAACNSYIKTLGTTGLASIGSCSGGAKIRDVGNGAGNYVRFDHIQAPTSGNYQMTLYSVVSGTRDVSVSVNGGTARIVAVTGPDWYTPVATTMAVTLSAGNNTVKLSNSSGYAPDIDRIVITSSAGSCTPESNSAFCARLARNCGTVTGNDNCGTTRTVSSCGTCSGSQTCGGSGVANVCGGSSGCSLTVTANDYDGASYWGTIAFRNNGPSSSSSYKVEFDVPGNVHCTNDAVPFGATLSPLTGSGASAHTTANHCVFTWSNASPLAAGASLTFHYSTDSSSFSAATNAVASDPVCQ